MIVNPRKDWEYDYPDGCPLEEVIEAKQVDWDKYTIEYYQGLTKVQFKNGLEGMDWWDVESVGEYNTDYLAWEVFKMSLYDQYRFNVHTGELLWVNL